MTSAERARNPRDSAVMLRRRKHDPQWLRCMALVYAYERAFHRFPEVGECKLAAQRMGLSPVRFRESQMRGMLKLEDGTIRLTQPGFELLELLGVDVWRKA